MVEVIVDGPSDKTIRPWAPHRTHFPYESVNMSGFVGEGEHVYLSVNGYPRKVFMNTPTVLTEGEVSALADAGFTVTPTGGG